MTLPSAIPAIIDAFFRGDRTAALALVDPDFGIHDGHTANAWIEHELAEFARRKPLLGINGVQVTDRASMTVPGAVGFSVLCNDGHFIFEDSLRVGPTGLVLGLGRNFEIVTKMHYSAGRKIRRGVAIRSPRGDIVKALILGTRHEDVVLHPGTSHEDDRFFTLDFIIPDDLCQGLHANLFVRDSAGVSGIEPIFLRGYDSPFHGSISFPGIADDRVDLRHLSSDSKRLWSLSVQLADGRRYVIEHPTHREYRFPDRVKAAIVTDAMDNDWQNEGAPS